MKTSAAQKALSCRHQYFSEIKTVLGWENRPVELSLQIEYVVSEVSTKLSLKNNQISIRSLAQTIATFYCDIRQMIPTSPLIFACSIVNIASYLTQPLIPCKDLATTLTIDYANLLKKTKFYYGTLVKFIHQQNIREEWGKKILSRESYF